MKSKILAVALFGFLLMTGLVFIGCDNGLVNVVPSEYEWRFRNQSSHTIVLHDTTLALMIPRTFELGPGDQRIVRFENEVHHTVWLSWRRKDTDDNTGVFVDRSNARTYIFRNN